jgi:hypothetical protein
MGLHGLLQGYLYLYLFEGRTARTIQLETRYTRCVAEFSERLFGKFYILGYKVV